MFRSNAYTVVCLNASSIVPAYSGPTKARRQRLSKDTRNSFSFSLSALGFNGSIASSRPVLLTMEQMASTFASTPQSDCDGRVGSDIRSKYGFRGMKCKEIAVLKA